MQKMMGGCPNSWWRQASEEGSLLLHCPSSIALSSNSIPLTSWCEEHELPQTWSQLLMGGSITHEEKCNLNCPLESQLNYNSQQGADEVHDLKQEASEDSAYSFSHGSSRGNILNFSNKKADRKHHSLDHSSESNSTGNEGAAKKARVQGSSLSQSSNLKVRKEKLGDRITALHQLVSPFGKTDTASVLLEAFGYIRFLQSQIEALSSPYLARGGSGNVRQPQDGNFEQKKDLRSRGLCLVPVSCTILQAESNINGADFWAPSIGGGF